MKYATAISKNSKIVVTAFSYQSNIQAKYVIDIKHVFSNNTISSGDCLSGGGGDSHEEERQFWKCLQFNMMLITPLKSDS